ncbi:hypothetical protein C2S51_022410 [Perilla frutescens var. frutescens]|nr:hypothetical protein C2S51_022410 [Perilla frutescens var. frutescens]
MKRYLKKCQKSRAAEEMRLMSLYRVLGNEYYTEIPANALSPPPSVDTSGCYKYDESAEAGRRRRLRSPDLEFECLGTEISTSIGVNFSREATSSVNISRRVMAKENEKLAAETASHQRKTPACPSAAELEEFFTEAEEYVQKRFSEKYNYDIMKDSPISEGRYQWVPTHI